MQKQPELPESLKGTSEKKKKDGVEVDGSGAQFSLCPAGIYSQCYKE